MKYKLRFSTVGAQAHEVTKVWKLGFHKFDLEDGAETIYRLCYFRSKHKTYYVQITKCNFERYETKI